MLANDTHQCVPELTSRVQDVRHRPPHLPASREWQRGPDQNPLTDAQWTREVEQNQSSIDLSCRQSRCAYISYAVCCPPGTCPTIARPAVLISSTFSAGVPGFSLKSTSKISEVCVGGDWELHTDVVDCHRGDCVS